ncbi:hypothetical protein F383_12863 [Gossypium arboreum]|uniref:Uncharacterized protein n=1 Tax=Gossypium arboreum TaxID=29729 RepID=A0A0B0NHD7_GOSAR|nr:hypothetical protein F383_12863 [Gossypium arboreum]
MGQHGKSTEPGLPHTGMAHGHGPVEPKLSSIRKMAILKDIDSSIECAYSEDE